MPASEKPCKCVFQGHFRTQFCGHWTLRLIYGAAIGFERGLQSRSQKVASNYDIYGALLELLQKAPVSTRAQFPQRQFELYLALIGRHLSFILGAQVVHWCKCQRLRRSTISEIK